MVNYKFRPDHVIDYFKTEWQAILLTTVSGLIYNIGLLCGPWFEGKMAECFYEIIKGQAAFSAMVKLAAGYVIAIGIVQIARYAKRFYVRRFANNINRRMKKTLYASLICRKRSDIEKEGEGNVITKAISDVDDCAEGMRKFTTEVFDTGVAMAGYVCMLLFYDWRLALFSFIFPPFSYIVAEKMKTVVQKTGAEFKKSNARLSDATLDRVSNAVTYRVFGCENERTANYEKCLKDYEKKAISSNIWSSSLTPLYRVVSLASMLFIIYFGAKNVMHAGWTVWDIAGFTTFVSCYTRLASKSSRAAKLFNAVHKAQVSWKRIKPYMEVEKEPLNIPEMKAEKLRADHFGFSYADGEKIFSDACFELLPGQIVGVTGPVACGKSTFGQAFLCDNAYEGSVLYGKEELSGMPENLRRGVVSYMGHDPEILNISIRDNILLGESGSAAPYLRFVSLEDEVNAMEDGEETIVGTGGVRLSGGQAQRLSLARIFKNKKPVMILDDPFSALDVKTEREIFGRMRQMAGDSIVILISHRLYLFPELDQVLWMNDGSISAGTHESMMKNEPLYSELYNEQKGGWDEK